MSEDSYYVTERAKDRPGKLWFVNGPTIDPDNAPDFDTPEEGRAYLVSIGIAPESISIEPF